jgi:phosphatidylserine/phosphatidylglycerophosphate/cardiolipin synthase-like enzyme
LAKSRHSTKKRFLLPMLCIALGVMLGIFANGNLVADVKHLLSLDSSPQATTINTAGTIEVIFSPNQGATAAIIKALAEAHKLILVSAYSFTSKEIAQALLDAKNRGVEIKLILDKSQVSQRYSSSTFFANLGFDLRIDIKHAIFHNKVMIIDDKTIVTGSFNFTKAAEAKNAENVLIIRNNPQLAAIYTQNWWFHWNQSKPIQEFKKKKTRP